MFYFKKEEEELKSSPCSQILAFHKSLPSVSSPLLLSVSLSLTLILSCMRLPPPPKHDGMVSIDSSHSKEEEGEWWQNKIWNFRHQSRSRILPAMHCITSGNFFTDIQFGVQQSIFFLNDNNKKNKARKSITSFWLLRCALVFFF